VARKGRLGQHACAVVVAAAVGWPGAAQATFKIHWECELFNTGVDCAVLESSLLSKVPFLAVVPGAARAEVDVRVANLPCENGTRLTWDLLGRSVDGHRPEVHASDKVPSSIDAATATVRLLSGLERALAVFLDQKVAGEVRDGTLELELVDPAHAPYAGRPEQQGVRWYFAPSVGSYFSDVVGVGVNASGSGSVQFNYSERTWRLQDSAGAAYSLQSQPVPGTSETASIHFVGGNTNHSFAGSLDAQRHWSVAALVGAEKNPQANYRFRASAAAGVEFDLIPRQTVNQRNLGARCAVGPEVQRYDVTNVEGRQSETVGREFCEAFLNWHFAPVDVGASLGETALLSDVTFRSVSAGLSATYRVTDNLLVSGWFNVQQIRRALNEAQASNVAYSDPKQEIEASMLAAVQQGYTAPLGFQSGVSVRYLFGNGSLSLEDQRWKGVSSLR